MLLACILLACVTLGYAMKMDHGGVPMGVKDVLCDDGRHNINVDWDPASAKEHTCFGAPLRPIHSIARTTCESKPKPGIHVCLQKSITYEEFPPTSGRHRPNWPRYGEYSYVPPQRWLHNLEHGGIVMLYHPCAEDKQVDLLRHIVIGCLHRHIISPSNQLPPETPFALLSWGCKLLMSKVAPSEAYKFIKAHAKHGPEDLSKDGQYDVGLKTPAALVSGVDDFRVCPLISQDDLVPKPEQSGDAFNAIARQSSKRRQNLNAVADNLQAKMDHLVQLYRKVVSQK